MKNNRFTALAVFSIAIVVALLVVCAYVLYKISLAVSISTVACAMIAALLIVSTLVTYGWKTT